MLEVRSMTTAAAPARYGRQSSERSLRRQVPVLCFHEQSVLPRAPFFETPPHTAQHSTAPPPEGKSDGANTRSNGNDDYDDSSAAMTRWPAQTISLAVDSKLKRLGPTWGLGSLVVPLRLTADASKSQPFWTRPWGGKTKLCAAQ